MSTELKARLDKVAEEDCKTQEAKHAANVPTMKELLLKIARTKSFNVAIWVEGTKQDELNKDEENLNMLERANIIKSQTRYTHRNVYRQYELTVKGAELAQLLAAEP